MGSRIANSERLAGFSGRSDTGECEVTVTPMNNEECITETGSAAMPKTALRAYALIRSLLSVSDGVAGYSEFAQQLLADCGPMRTAQRLCDDDGYRALTDAGTNALEALRRAQACILGNEVPLPDALDRLGEAIQTVQELHASSRAVAADLVDAYPDLLTNDEARSYASRLSTYLHVLVFIVASFFGLDPLRPLRDVLVKEMSPDAFSSLRGALDRMGAMIDEREPVGAWRIMREVPDLAFLPGVSGCVYEEGIPLGVFEALKGRFDEVSPNLFVARGASMEVGDVLVVGYGRLTGLGPTRSYEYVAASACSELPIYAFDGQSIRAVLADPLSAIANAPELEGARNFSIHPLSFAQALDRSLRCVSFVEGGKRQTCLACGGPVTDGMLCKKRSWFAR